MSTLYNDRLFAWARQRDHQGALPDGRQATRHSTWCSDEITLSVQQRGGRIEAIRWHGEACLICRASAARLCQLVEGQPRSALPALRSALEAALAPSPAAPAPADAALPRAPAGTAPPSPLSAFRALRDHPSRAGCARLPWQALEDALADAPAAAPSPRDEHAPTAQPPAALPPVAHARDAWSAALGFLDRGQRVAIATLISVEGSSPCPLGSHLVVAEDGSFWGAVSGGCVESAVVQAGLRLLAGEDDPRGSIGRYQIANSQAGAVGLPCGGQVRIHVGPAPDRARLEALRDAPAGALRRLFLDEGRCVLVPPGAPLPDGPRATSILGRPVFEEPLHPGPRLILVGGTRIAQILSRLAAPLGYRVVVIEPRPGFAQPDRFPGVPGRPITVRQAPVAEALPPLLDADSALLTLTHKADLDDPALTLGLPSPAWYVGALGSRKTQAGRLERLRAQGLPEHHLARLHGPAGLPIGALGAEEIALSILAELVATRRRLARPPRIGAVLLAAGASRRAGPRNKLLQPLAGAPLVRHAARALLDAGLRPITVVLGHEAEQVRAALADLPLRFVHNPDWAHGMGRSLAVGVRAQADEDLDGLVVALGDMPWVQPADLQRLLRAHRPATRHLVIAPETDGGTGPRISPPMLWPARYFPALAQLDGDEGGRSLLRAAPGAVLRVPVASPAALEDVDVILEGAG